MILRKLEIVNFKNIGKLNVGFHDKLNCIVGKNGIGKTNLLDSIYYLSHCKSNFPINDEMLIMHGENFFNVQGDFFLNDSSNIVFGAYSKDKKKVFRRNDKKYNRLADHIGLIPLVFVTPSDISLINGSGAERRRFIDSFISQFNSEYLNNLMFYNKALAQRNKYLKQAGRSKLDLAVLDAIDFQLSDCGTKIFEERRSIVDKLIPHFIKYYSNISSSEEVVGLSYESSLSSESFASLLKKNRDRDLILQHTSQGIHRDDIHFSLSHHLVRLLGSQGQKKSFLLALKFAQYDFISKMKGQKALLLLDDLFDKLDPVRVEKIVEIVTTHDFGQIFITDTDKETVLTIYERFNKNGVMLDFAELR